MKIPVETPYGQLTTEVVLVEKTENDIVILGYRYSYEYLAVATVGISAALALMVGKQKYLIGSSIIFGSLFVANMIFKPKEL